MGFGAAPLGNMFRNIPDQEAAATVEAAWRQGTRYFDTAPLYGAGLSEIRLGRPPFPVTNYLSTLRVEGSNDGKTCQVEGPAALRRRALAKRKPSSCFRVSVKMA